MERCLIIVEDVVCAELYREVFLFNGKDEVHK